jgi:hypothetical protein
MGTSSAPDIRRRPRRTIWHPAADELINPKKSFKGLQGNFFDCRRLPRIYFGREIIIPIALAILLSFVLAPLVGFLQRIRVPRGLAVVSVVILAFALIFAMGSLLAAQLTQLAGDLPRYQSTISEKIQSFRDTAAGRGTLERASGMLKDLSMELDKPKDPGSASGAGTMPGTKAPAPLMPVPVEVRQPDPGALESLQSLISPLLHPLATTGIIIIFVIFILLQREDLRNRLIRLAGSHDLQRTTAALDAAAIHLRFSFPLMLFEGSLELRRLGRLGHLRQGRQDFLFREVNILQGINKQVFQFFLFSHDALNSPQAKFVPRRSKIWERESQLSAPGEGGRRARAPLELPAAGLHSILGSSATRDF